LPFSAAGRHSSIKTFISRSVPEQVPLLPPAQL
jgi:hypothetical protein